MIEGTFPDKIIQQHLNCCLVPECEDECCELMVDGWSIPPLALIRGRDYQHFHRLKGPLCDFTIFGRSSKRFVCAIEMKGGNNLQAKHAVEQIQAGLLIAESMVQPGEYDNWYPILLRFDDAGNDWDIRFLASPNAYVRFHGARARVELHECGSRLDDILGFGP